MSNDTDFADGTWEFACVDWDTATLDLYKPADDPSRFCDMSMGAIDATSERMIKGAQFSSPTYEGSLQLLIYVPNGTVDRWTFLAPFKAELWLALFGTAAAVALCIWLQEVPLARILRHPLPALQKLSNLQWASMALLLQFVAEFSARRTGARLTILGYGFLVLIVINTYMAVLASRLTVNSIKLNINGLNDLATKPVGVFEDYVSMVKEHTSLLVLVPLPWNTLDDEHEMIRKLRAGELAALLFDAPWVQYQAANSCDLYVVNEKQKILPFNYGFGFPVDYPPSRLAQVNMALAKLMEGGIFTALESQYIKPAMTCQSKIAQADLASVQLGFEQMSGLWIFLAAATGLGWAVDLSQALWSCWRRRRSQAAVATTAQDEPYIPGGEMGMRRASDLGRRMSSAVDLEQIKVLGKAPSMSGAAGGGGGGGGANGGGNTPGGLAGGLGGLGSRGSMSGALNFLRAPSASMRIGERTRSFLGHPEVADSWMAVADASTVEEMVEVLELQIRHMDMRLRKALPALERRVDRIDRGQQQILDSVEETMAVVKAATGIAGAPARGGIGGGGGGYMGYGDFSRGGVSGKHQQQQQQHPQGVAGDELQRAEEPSTENGGGVNGGGNGVHAGVSGALRAGVRSVRSMAADEGELPGLTDLGSSPDSVTAFHPPFQPPAGLFAKAESGSFAAHQQQPTAASYSRRRSSTGSYIGGSGYMGGMSGPLITAASGGSRSVRRASRVQFQPAEGGGLVSGPSGSLMHGPGLLLPTAASSERERDATAVPGPPTHPVDRTASGSGSGAAAFTVDEGHAVAAAARPLMPLMPRSPLGRPPPQSPPGQQ